MQEEDPQHYRDRLRRIHRYIVEGDIFQANLSRLWQGRFRDEPDPVSLYARLRESNPAPFAALVRFDANHHLLSSSPERLIEVRDGIIETRPIAGTHPRGKTEPEDRALAERLLAHPKERAEHVMLIDLERNDLGRICEPGSIHLEDRMTLETYRHVHHIVSSVRGRLRPEIGPRQALHAVFPGGTITGCPKVRCMQIIRELETEPRGGYTGSLGYISDHGRMDFNILIRSMTLRGRELSLRAGAGIVHDSDPQRELQETRHKARGMLHAVATDH
jgi:anthranilate synthase component 1